MAKRPQGLSPSFDSVISPQIPSSLTFSWTFIKENNSDAQKSAIVKVFPSGKTTPLFSVNATTDSEASISAHLAKLTLEETYEWEVVVTAANNSTASSGKASFIYGAVLVNGLLEWPESPKPYEYIGTRKYFEEISENAIAVLGDYVVNSTEEKEALKLANSLFIGDIVPSRTDFVNIENILSVIAKKESSYKDEVDNLIKDGLGASDIKAIYDFFDRLVKIPPVSPSNIYLSFENAEPLKVVSGTVKNNGKADLTIDVRWNSSDLETGTCTLHFGSELTEDIAYYEIELIEGFTDYSITHTLIYRLQDIIEMDREKSFDMSHIEYHDLSKSKKTYYSIRAIAVDKRDMNSAPYSKGYTVANVPIGVSKYQLRTQQNDLSDKKVLKKYHDIYTGPKMAYVHNVKGNPDGNYHYAVRLYDINGNTSPWYYIPNKILVDPLQPPGAPKPTVKSADTDSILFTWPSVKTADSYEIDPQTGSNSTTTGLTKEITGLKEKTKYTIKVRAKNKAGASKWVSVSGTTKAKPIVTHTEKDVGMRVWRTDYVIYKQNGNTVKNSAEYRNKYDDKEAFHGEWIELRNKVQDGIAVKKGTRWGNNKSIFFLNESSWVSKLKGKAIVDVQIYIKRKSSAHGYPNDGRFLHVYTHNYAGKGNLPSASKGPTLSNHHQIKNLDWNRGEGHWVTLPKSYGELLRDGKMKGIAFYHPDAHGKGPYSYMRFDADTFQFKVRYK